MQSKDSKEEQQKERLFRAKTRIRTVNNKGERVDIAPGEVVDSKSINREDYECMLVERMLEVVK